MDTLKGQKQALKERKKSLMKRLNQQAQTRGLRQNFKRLNC